MTAITLDTSRLLGFKLSAPKAGAKVGQKPRKAEAENNNGA